MSSKKSNLKPLSYLLYFAILGTGIICGYFLSVHLSKGKKTLENQHPETINQSIISTEDFELLNPVVCTPLYQQLIFDELNPFKNKVEKYTLQIIKEGKAKNISVYFRDLNNGWWFGIEEKKLFSPASLMKVPVMIAIFKLEQELPGTLSKELKYEKSGQNQQLGLDEKVSYGGTVLTPGSIYTINELVKNMIIYSDNEATLLLLQYLERFDPDYMDNVNRELGLIISNETGSYDNFLSVKRYSTFFRILYNASYLNPTYSNKALRLLSQSVYDGGIRKMVPPNITVAHKFGRKSIPTVDNGLLIDQLHHFGIVYYPRLPYMLGIMVQGKNEADMQKIIEEITAMIYAEVEKQVKEIPEDILKNDIDPD